MDKRSASSRNAMKHGLAAAKWAENEKERIATLAELFKEGRSGTRIEQAAIRAAEAREYLERVIAARDQVLAAARDASRERAVEADIDISQPVGFIVLNVKERAARCRIPGTQRVITFRSRDVWRAIPGEILTVRANRYWRYSATSYLSGLVESRKIDVPALGLTPLALEERGMWDPADECWGDEGEPLPAWAKAITWSRSLPTTG